MAINPFPNSKKLGSVSSFENLKLVNLIQFDFNWSPLKNKLKTKLLFVGFTLIKKKEKPEGVYY